MKPKKLPRYLSPDQVLLALENSAGELRLFIDVGYCTGGRVSELLGLTWADVNLDEGTAVVRGKGGKERLVYLGGSVHALRLAANKLPEATGYLLEEENPAPFAHSVPLPRVAQVVPVGVVGGTGTTEAQPKPPDPEVTPWPLIRNGLDVTKGVSLNPTSHIFTLTSQQARDRLAALGRRLGFHLHPHLLRHAFASHQLNRLGHSALPAVAEMLGHESWRTTTIYWQGADPRLQALRRCIVTCLPRARRYWLAHPASWSDIQAEQVDP